jgi:hypothetical protein
MHIMKSKGCRIDPCGTPCFIIPNLGRNSECQYIILFQPFMFCLLDRIWNKVQVILECCKSVI